MNRSISPWIFYVAVLAAGLIVGVPLYWHATEPLYLRGVPESPAEAPDKSGFRLAMPAPTMRVATTASVPLVDVAETAGLRYEWTIPGKRPLNILQTIGNGCAFLDYNNDGKLDILLVGYKLGLYQGDGQGRFSEVTHDTGLDKLSGHFLGCAVGDYDNDGYEDLYISAYRGGVLLHNDAFRRSVGQVFREQTLSEHLDAPIPEHRIFRDVTAEAGLAPQPWGTSCAFVETVPGSGRLDLYVCNYVDFGPDTEPQLCTEAGVLTACAPTVYRPLKGVLYSNDGRGHFRDSTQVSGADAVAGKGLGVAVADYDGSGRPSLAIANDEMPGDLLRPAARGAGRLAYQNVAVSSGTAYDRDGNLHNGMGIDWGDYDNDGRPDLFITAFVDQTKSLYHNNGDGMFSDRAMLTGIQGAALPYVAFGCKFFDYDNDGWLDLMIANGHVKDNAAEIIKTRSYRQPTQLFHNTGARGRAFEDVSRSSPDLMRPIVGRGLAVGDYDNDGRVDALVVDSEGKPLLLHNHTRPAGHWLGVKLIGAKSNRDGYGAVLTVKAGGHTRLRQCQTCGSYLSASDRRVHFGLGDANQADSLIVRWPGGHTDTYRNLAGDRYVTIREGDPRR